MPDAPVPFDPRSLEPEVLRLWKARRLPPASGTLGPGDGPILRQFEGTFGVGDAVELVVHRAVLADTDARHRLLTGRGTVGTLREERATEIDEPSPAGAALAALGVWTGGPGGRPWDTSDRRAGVQGIVARLARREIVAARDGPLRVCVACGVPRTPERIVYQKEVGDTYLVRFPIAGTDPSVDALVWVDAPWRLLGASALLVHPDVPYAVVDFQRRGATARLLTSRGSIARLKAWMPDIELTVVEERPGREWVGRPYAYPLRHEFPIGGSLDPPAGTIQADPEVGDTGTGLVPLVPGHGPTDAEIAERLGISGWPLLTAHGLLDPILMHKYAGLDVETASEFVARDLTEGGAVLARLRVVRGVPYCAICGHRMVWTPGRAWCLEPSRLPPEQRERYARLLPHDRPIGQIEVARWPVSETTASRAPDAVTLLECARCERLEAPDGPLDCPCGGTRRAVARRLLPSIAGALAAWAGAEPLAAADTVRVYANDRRRVPALVHHLAAMTGADASSADVGLTLAPTVSRIDVPALLARYGADAVRSAFVRASGRGRTTPTFEERCRQESARLAALFARATEMIGPAPPEVIREAAQPLDASARDLEVEDRAILARWARTQLKVRAAYDRFRAEEAHRLLYRFLEVDLAAYLGRTRGRAGLAGLPPSKRATLRIRVHLLRAAAVALAPIAPFTAEAVHRRLGTEARSLFETVDLAPDRGLADDALAAAWDRWGGVIAAADRVRRAYQLSAQEPIPAAAIVLPEEEAAARLRSDRATLERLARIGKLEVASPQVPWAARQRRFVPVESEIQRAYPQMASQIVHLLERMPPRRPSDAARDVTLFVAGVPRTITPEMLAAVDTLPEGFVPTPYPGGEMYVQLPSASGAARPPPPLSPDAFWLVRRLGRWMRRAVGPSAPDGHVAIVAAVDPLAGELREKAAAIAGYLGLHELRVVDAAPAVLPHARLEGRTRTGARWTVAVPGARRPARKAKHRAPVSDGRRLPPPRAAPPSGAVDFADEAVIAREQSVRELGRELDELVHAPLLGPAKVSIAWDAGLRSLEQFRSAPFDQLAALTGFGRPVAATLFVKLGRSPPPPPTRPRRSAPVVTAVAVPPPVSTRSVVPTPAAVPPPPPPPFLVEAPPAPDPAAVPPQAPAPPPPEDSPERGPPISEPSEEAPAEPAPNGPSAPVDPLRDTVPVPPTDEPAALETSADADIEGAAVGPTEAVPEVVPPSVPATELTVTASSDDAPGTTDLAETSSEPTPGSAAASESGHRPEESLGVLAAAGGEALAEVAPDAPSPPADVPGEAPPPEPSLEAVDSLAPVDVVPAALEPAPLTEAVASEGAVPEATAPAAVEAPMTPGGPREPIAGSPEADATTETVSDLVTEPPATETAPAAPSIPAAPAPGNGDAPTLGAPAPPAPRTELPSPAEAVVATASAPPTIETAGPDSGSAPEVPSEPIDTGPVPASPVLATPEDAINDLVVAERSGEPPPSTPGTAVSSVETSSPPTSAVADGAVLSPEAPLGPSGPQPPAEPATLPPTEEPTVPPAIGVAELPAPAEVAPPIPPVELPPPPPAGVEIDSSSALFIALQPFLDATAAGHRGIAVVRELPERIRVHVGPRPVEVFWLTNLPRPRALRPTDLSALTDRIRDEIRTNGVTAIFLEGIEYLVGVHGIDRVVGFLSELDATARQHAARIWVHLTPSLVSEKDLARLTAIAGAPPSTP